MFQLKSKIKFLNNNSSKPNTKSFRITKKGINTGIFMEMQRPQQININISNHQIRINPQNKDQ
jgi:hypothetical protein